MALSSVYNLLHRHGWRKLAPDKRHPQSDPLAQQEFRRQTCSGLTNVPSFTRWQLKRVDFRSFLRPQVTRVPVCLESPLICSGRMDARHQSAQAPQEAVYPLRFIEVVWHGGSLRAQTSLPALWLASPNCVGS